MQQQQQQQQQALVGLSETTRYSNNHLPDQQTTN